MCFRRLKIVVKRFSKGILMRFHFECFRLYYESGCVNGFLVLNLFVFFLVLRVYLCFVYGIYIVVILRLPVINSLFNDDLLYTAR